MKDVSIRDDINSLNKMAEDMRSARPLYKPTNYWQFYEPDILNYLKSKGLKNFRSFDTGRIASLGAGTYKSAPLSHRFKKLADSAIFKIYGKIFGALGGMLDLVNVKKFIDVEKHYLQDFRGFQASEYRYSKLADKLSGLNILDSIEDSGVANPYDLFEINGRKYTLSFLKYFTQMTHVMRHVGAGNVKTVMEIGSGYGGSCEVYVKAFPNITYFNFDIAPAIYIAQQYLQAVFPGRVYTYENFLAKEKIDPEKYRVFCLPSWVLESLSGVDFDLFINAASFQEMEPDVVKNYYEMIKNRIDYAYLFELTGGTYKKTSMRSGGVVEPLKMDDYIRIFKDFKVLARDEYFRIGNSYTQLILKR